MSQDFFLGQLRVALIAILAYAGGKGWLKPDDAGVLKELMVTLGPVFGPWIWSVYANINTKRAPTTAVVVDVGGVPTKENAPHLQAGMTATVQTAEGMAVGKVVG